MRRAGVWFSLGAIAGSLLVPAIGAVLGIWLHEWNIDRHERAVESSLRLLRRPA